MRNKAKAIKAAAVFVGVIALSFTVVACASGRKTVYVSGGTVVTAADFRIGAVVPALPRGHVKVVVGGAPFYYHDGHYFRPVPGGFKVVVAPVGARITKLPPKYVRVRVGKIHYYRHNGVYYRWDKAHRRYIVVKPPRR